MSEFEKLDSGLAMALRAYRTTANSPEEDAGISVSLKFEGDLAPITALGFDAHSEADGEALGIIKFKDIPAIADHPSVQWIAAGRMRSPDLDTAVGDIRARASAAGNVGSGGDGLWHAVVATGALTSSANGTGEGVIVAVIDTGIDFTHPMFMKQMTPKRKTRILRIWDQGLVPASVAEGPPAALLESTNTYGVEYDDTEIDAALDGGTPVLHKDCTGHGTHVAGIAAGGVLFPAGGNAENVGVAPEADIIAVKMLDNQDNIRYRLAAGPGAQVGASAQFHDAVLYCLRTAKAMAKPIVINMSFGNSSEAGDGLDDDARWVDQRMDPAQAAGPLNFPTGAIVVKSMGNSGNPTRRQFAEITVPAGGQITVPMELSDSRGGIQDKWKNCARSPHSPPVGVDFWYRRTNPFTAAEFALRLPHGAAFTGNMGVGGFLDRGFVPRVGPPPSVAIVGDATTVHSAFVRHNGNPSVPHPGGSVRRHQVQFWLEPKRSGGNISYYEAIYEMRIRAPAGTVVYAMCDRRAWGPGIGVKFEIAGTMQDGSALDPGIVVSAEKSAGDPLGQHAISVGSYTDTEGNAADPDHHAISGFSSRGPLRDYSNPPGLPLIATKPDISAPGTDISSAHGVHTDTPIGIRLPPWNSGIRFVEHSGTSMSAPMVAGVVALMLDKKPDLTTTDVRTILNAAARTGADPAAGTAHTNAYGSGMVDALASHTNTP